MDGTRTPAVKDLVLVGGGHSHVFVLKRFGMEPLPGVRVTLVCRDTHAPYSGMLPGLIAGHYTYDEAHIDLERLASFAGARFLYEEVVGLDRIRREVICRSRPPVAYDLLSINIGSRPRTGDVPGALEATVPVKPIDGFVAKWDRLRRRCLAREGPTIIAVVGGGAGGVELLLAAQYALRNELRDAGRDPAGLEMRLYTATPDVLKTHNRSVRRRFQRVLRERRVKVFTECRVVEVSEAGQERVLRLADGATARAHEVLWATSAAAQAWPGDAGLAVDERGFIRVSDTLQSVNAPEVLAAGDIATMVRHPRPKSGVFAVRQGPPLAENLRRLLRGERPRPFRPQERFLSLVSTGDRYAVASRSYWACEGRWVWRWKDRIDRRFMARFSELPEMEPGAPAAADGVAGPEARAALAAAVMRCAGCGSKVGGDVVARALARLPASSRSDVVVGLQAPDDAAVIAVPAGKLVVQSVDFFRAPVEDPYVFGRIAANHALGDLWAMGAQPRSALAIVQVPFAIEDKMEHDVFHMLAGAVSVLEPAGAVLVGGHTVEGPDMALGFAVTGIGERQEISTKGGLRAGQALVLTKALGTGAVLAARMRRRAKGRWVQAALTSMTLGDGAGATILRRYGATAMTDVTGFGLVGHLHEMLAAAGLDARVEPEAVRALPGALEVIEDGIFSSLQPSNLRLRHVVRGGYPTGSSRFALLFDPQTAGGLLAGVPAERARECVRELRTAGYESAAIIGAVLEPAGEGGEIELADPPALAPDSLVPGGRV